MPTVHLANICNESMQWIGPAETPAPTLSDAVQRWGIDTVTGTVRMAWFMAPGDILVGPKAAPAEFLEHVAQTKGFASGSLRSAALGSEPRIITNAHLLSEEAHKKLSSLIKGRSGPWTLHAYHRTPAVDLAGNRLGLGFAGDDFVGQGGAHLMNSKRAFRALCTGAALPLPAGAVCNSRRELLSSIKRLAANTGALIVKQDVNAGGSGNRILGAEQINAELATDCRALWSDLDAGDGNPLIVEVFHAGAHSLWFEFLIDESDVRALGHGGQRMSGLNELGEMKIIGFEMPAALPDVTQANFHEIATKAAILAQNLGYRGSLIVDAMATDEGRILLNEFNGRRGGCSHFDEIATACFGAAYGGHWHMLSATTHTRLSFAAFAARISSAGLALDTRGGTVVSCYDSLDGTASVEHLTFAHSRDEAEERVRRLSVLLQEVAE